MKKIMLRRLSFLFIIAPVFLHGQDTALLKRMPYKLAISVDKETFYQEDLKETAYVLPNKTIQVYPGEEIFIEIDQAAGIINNVKAVKEIKDSSKTLIINFTQTATNKVHESMKLEITNPFAYQSIYKAKMFLLKQKRWADTDVYAVGPGLTNYEIWQEILASLALGDWKFEKG